MDWVFWLEEEEEEEQGEGGWFSAHAIWPKNLDIFVSWQFHNEVT